MLLFPPGGACTFTDVFSVVGPQFEPEIILCPCAYIEFGFIAASWSLEVVILLFNRAAWLLS